VSSDVRTLANDLQQKAGELHTTIEPIEAVISYKALRQSMVKVLPLCRPLATYWPIALVTWIIGFEVFGSAEVAGLLLAVSLSCLGLFLLFKLAVPAELSLPWWIMRLLSILVGGVAVLPTFLVALSLSRTTFQTLSSYTLLFCAAFITLVSMASTVLEASRVKSVRILQRANTRLNREITIFEQRLWLERRSWQFAVHGSVQASLTAALTRLHDESLESGNAVKQVRKDISRAIRSIEYVSTQGVDIAEALGEIRDTWAGISNIDVTVSVDASKALSTNDSAAVCVNEVCKEAVNNAIKHGEATQIDLLVDMTDQQTLRIIALNNGKPLKAKVNPNVGSALLDELTLSWHLNALKRGGKTKFEALVPLASK
jgi:two-component sensor histidine kinase